MAKVCHALSLAIASAMHPNTQATVLKVAWFTDNMTDCELICFSAVLLLGQGAVMLGKIHLQISVFSVDVATYSLMPNTF
jgi:hypothetical protein